VNAHGKEGEAQAIRRSEDESQLLSHQDRDRETEATRGAESDIGIGVGGTIREGKNRPGTVNGGIIAQLITDAEARLGEAQECVEWYLREIRKCEQRLEQLHHLLELERQQSQKQLSTEEE